MITNFITKHNITMYRLSKLLDVPQTTIQRWCKDGPQHPERCKPFRRQLRPCNFMASRINLGDKTMQKQNMRGGTVKACRYGALRSAMGGCGGNQE
jgi:hypothetical protein